jgi:hypothetical protein
MKITTEHTTGRVGCSSKALFRLIDRDHGGTIDQGEFNRGLLALGVQITAQQASRIWPVFDIDGDGSVTELEFTAAMALSLTATHDHHEKNVSDWETAHAALPLATAPTKQIVKAVLEVVGHIGCSPRALFRLVDTDDSGSIDQE